MGLHFTCAGLQILSAQTSKTGEFLVIAAVMASANRVLLPMLIAIK